MLLGGGYFPVYFNISAHMYKMFVRWWFDIVVDIDKLFTYDIYIVIYPMSCLPVSKIYGMLGGLLMSGLVIVEVMLILVYDNLCSVYATYVS